MDALHAGQAGSNVATVSGKLLQKRSWPYGTNAKPSRHASHCDAAAAAAAAGGGGADVEAAVVVDVDELDARSWTFSNTVHYSACVLRDIEAYVTRVGLHKPYLT